MCSRSMPTRTPKTYVLLQKACKRSTSSRLPCRTLCGHNTDPGGVLFAPHPRKHALQRRRASRQGRGRITSSHRHSRCSISFLCWENSSLVPAGGSVLLWTELTTGRGLGMGEQTASCSCHPEQDGRPADAGSCDRRPRRDEAAAREQGRGQLRQRGPTQRTQTSAARRWWSCCWT